MGREMREKIKTAAYVRVSADSEQTHHSLQAQAGHYRKLIEENPEWEFAGIYADYGISGTGTRKREAFNQMIKACEAGNVEQIITKSVSRFARNTVDLLQTTRHLKQFGVSVWFEEQQIDSLTEEGELMLTLIASLAQVESESLSENARWAIRRKFQKGIGNTRRRTLGYQWIDGKQVVIPAEAEAVKQIFTDYLAGKSYREIREALNRKNITSIHGNPISNSAIRAILKNNVYTGDTLLQKTFIQDPISKKKVINTGQLPQYLVKNDHEAIITKEIFEQAQEKLARNKRGKRVQYPFTGKVVCGACGKHYIRQLWNASRPGEKRPTWICAGKKDGSKNRCRGKNISEQRLMKASAEVLGMEVFEGERVREGVERIVVGEEGEMIFEMKKS